MPSVGKAMMSPCGVNTNTSEAFRSNRNESRNSSGSSVSRCQSNSWRTQARSSGLLLSPTAPVLYRQCAATPNSAARCIWLVRICSSTGFPEGPITAVCSD